MTLPSSEPDSLEDSRQPGKNSLYNSKLLIKEVFYLVVL